MISEYKLLFSPLPGTKTIQLPMNRLMEMLKGSGGAGKTITLVKTPDGRTVTYVLSTPPGQQGTPQPEKRKVGRPPGSVRGPYRKTIQTFGRDGVRVKWAIRCLLVIECTIKSINM